MPGADVLGVGGTSCSGDEPLSTSIDVCDDGDEGGEHPVEKSSRPIPSVPSVFRPVAAAISPSARLSGSSQIVRRAGVGTSLSPASTIIDSLGHEHPSLRRGVAIMVFLAREDIEVLSTPDASLLPDGCTASGVGQGICDHPCPFARKCRLRRW